MTRDRRQFAWDVVFALAMLAFVFFAARVARGQSPSGTIRVVAIPGVMPGQPVSQLPDKASFDDLQKDAWGAWNAAARGHITLAYATAPPYQLTAPRASCDDTTWEGTAAVASANLGFVGDAIAFYLNDSLCRYGGDAAVGGSTFRMTVMNIAIWMHEMGHKLGLWHKFGLTWGGEVLGFAWEGGVGDFSRATYKEYSDPNDVMGGGSHVGAMNLQLLGWMIPKFLDRLPVQQVTVTPGAWNAVSVRRADGRIYVLEINDEGTIAQPLDLRTNAMGSGSFVQSLHAGDVYDDEFGGVKITMTDQYSFQLETFTPAPLPTPTVGPPTTPTERPTYSTLSPTPSGGGTCWVVEPYIKCSPTPNATFSPSPTASATLTPSPLNTSTAAPAATATATPSSSPTVSASPSSTPSPRAPMVPTRTATPSKSASGGGCLGGAILTPFFIACGLATWKRRIE